jgi:hypothetical protein
MPLLLALALSAALAGGPPIRTATIDPLRVTVTIGQPRVISVESGDGWTAPGNDVVAPTPVAPARFEMTIPARPAAGPRNAALETV